MAKKLTQKYVVKNKDAPDPAPVFKFWIELKSDIVAEFKECSGLRVERKIELQKEGGVNDYVHKLPGRIEHSNLTFKYGIIADDKLWQWFQKGLYDGQVERLNFSILLRDVKGDVVRRWDVIDAYPVKWEGPQLNTEGNQIAIETIEIAHHGLKFSQ